MPLTRLCVSILLVSAPVLALAQVAGDIDGKWKANFLNQGGRAVGAAVTFKGNEGTWRTNNPPRDNACLAREAPLTVERTPDAIKVKVLYSKLMTGCTDSALSLKLEGAALKGQFAGSGRPVELVRD